MALHRVNNLQSLQQIQTVRQELLIPLISPEV